MRQINRTLRMRIPMMKRIMLACCANSERFLLKNALGVSYACSRRHAMEKRWRRFAERPKE